MSVENLKKFANRLGQTDAFIVNATVDILNNDDIGDKIEEMNRGQLRSGVDAGGDKMGKYKSYTYIQERQSKSLQTEFIDLGFDGDFYGSIVSDSFANGKEPVVEMTATDNKWENATDTGDSLKSRFPNALGLTKESAEKVGGLIAPKLAQKISNFWKI